MKKINAIFAGTMDKVLLPIKVRKVNSAIDNAILNAEDDLQTASLKYEELLAKLPTSDCIEDVLSRAVDTHKRMTAIKETKAALLAIKEDLDSEVETEEK